MAATEEPRWEALLRNFRASYPELYRTWFDELPAPTLAAGELRVPVADPARRRYLLDSCSRAFAQVATALAGRLLTVRFVGPADGQPSAQPEPHTAERPRVNLNPDYTFEQFVVGPSNRLAHAACRAVCGQPGTLYNPLFIHGASGLGKTHLLQATCAELIERRPETNACYTPCEAFVNDFVRAIETGRVLEFRDAIRTLDVLIIDDVQSLANREATQEELFHTFNALYQTGKQVILSADAAPAEIPTLEDRLISRFSWGLVAQIDPPNRETRQAILHKKARLRGCEVPDEVLDLIAERVESNVRVLEGALTRLISETQLGGKPMDLDTARWVLAQVEGHPARPPELRDVLRAVAAHFGVRVTDLLSRKRSRSVSHPRQVSMYLARKLTPLSLQEIGAHLGGRDHSTVLHAERVIEAARRSDPAVADTIAQLTRQLLSAR